MSFLQTIKDNERDEEMMNQSKSMQINHASLKNKKISVLMSYFGMLRTFLPTPDLLLLPRNSFKESEEKTRPEPPFLVIIRESKHYTQLASQ
jgi:hypothetical protein